MRRWVQHALAAQLGIAMNIDFEFPAEFARRVFGAALGAGEDAAFSPAILPWRVLAEFPEVLAEPAFEQLRAYTAGEGAALKRYQLARRVGAVFDRYLAYRPEWLLRWTADHADHWQAKLWQRLAHDRSHPPAQLARLREVLAADCSALVALPERVSVFGLSSLAPFYVQLIDAVSKVLDVHLFLLEPTDLYWGEILDEREQRRFLKRHARRDQAAADFHLETGNALLASLGKVGRDFSRIVQDLEPAEIAECFAAPKGESLLGRVQRDIFALRERTPAEREIVQVTDRSIQVHCCHSPLREVEVLQDHLLALFETIPGLEPRDVLVAMPEIESYAPLIEAVFGAPEDETLRIPFTIADRSVRAKSSVAEAFLRVLDLRGGRFGAATVFAILEAPAARAHFALTEGDLEILRLWIDHVGIRWGIDAEHRAGLDLPAFPANTWREGFRRLLLGYALPGDEQTLFENILPVREVEADLAVKLGQFIDFAEILFTHLPRLSAPRPLGEWAAALGVLVDALFDPGDEFADEVHALRRACHALNAIASAANFAEPIAFEVIRAHFGNVLGESEGGTGFLGGGVAFCALKPLRSIPFRVVCLLGMTDTAFPRQERALPFDLVGKDLQPGDRSLRDDDRYLFLEAILSARDLLYLGYSGLSMREQTEAPPSACVSELLDYLDANFALPDARLREDLVLTHHRLQPFSAAYFGDDPRLFSYSAPNARAGQTRAAERHRVQRFFQGRLPPVEPLSSEVTLDQLLSFIVHPVRFFARERLGLRVLREGSPLLEREPLELDALAETRLRGDLAAADIAGMNRAASLALLRARGGLPHGTIGEALHDRLRVGVKELVRKVEPWLAEAPLPTVPIDLRLGKWHLTGSLPGLRQHAQVCYRAANLTAKDRLRAWLSHLVLQAVRSPAVPDRTLVFSLDEDFAFGPLDSIEPLRELLTWYERGWSEPLPFFPVTSWVFVEESAKPPQDQRGSPAAAAQRAWSGSGGDYGGERADPYVTLCFRGVDDPLDHLFAELATAIYQPLRQATEPVP